MKEVKWSVLKSRRLKRTRGVSFEEIIKAEFVDFKDNPRRQNQRIMLFEYKNYIWLVPFVQEGNTIFLKTLYPSRKYTKIYRKERTKHETD